MDIEVKYRAKDGMCFDDINACEKYEKSLITQPGSLGYFLEQLKKSKETDYFTGIIFYKENGKLSFYSRAQVDLSDLYEGEIITQTMKDVQTRMTSTVKQALEFFKGMDPSISCGGSYMISSNPRMIKGFCCNIPCYDVFRDGK